MRPIRGNFRWTIFIKAVCDNPDVAGRIYKRSDLVQGEDKKIEGVPNLRIVYRDTFNLKYFYLLMHEWFIDNGFTGGSRDDEVFPEAMFIHRDFGDMKQLWWRWRFMKTSPTSPLFRWHVDVDVQILGLKTVETVVNGQKVKADSAEFEIFLTPTLFLNTSKWKENPVTKFMAPVLENVVYRKLIEEEKKIFENIVWRMQEAIKTYFKLETYLPERQSHEFHPKADFQT